MKLSHDNSFERDRRHSSGDAPHGKTGGRNTRRVAFFSTVNMEYGGGLEKYFVEVSSALSNMPDLQVDIVCLSDRLVRKFAAIQSLARLKMPKKPTYRETPDSIRGRLRGSYYRCDSMADLRMRLKQYDLIYSRNELIEALMFKFSLGYKQLPPVIFGCHTAISYSVATSSVAKLHNWLYQGAAYKYLASQVQSFHAINLSDAEALRRMFPSKLIRQIANPFNFDDYALQSRVNTFKFNFREPKTNILWVGHLNEQKGVRELADIIHLTNERYGGQVRWNIVGGAGAESNLVSNLVRDWPNVNYYGYIETRFMPSVYLQSDIFLSTSKWEGFPYNLLEAQCFGLPVIAFDIPGCREIIDSGKNGYLVNDEAEFIDRLSDHIEKKTTGVDISAYIRNKFNQQYIYEELRDYFLANLELRNSASLTTPSHG